MHIGVEQISVKCLQTSGDSLLQNAACHKSLGSHVLVKGSKEIEITGREIENCMDDGPQLSSNEP